MKILVTGSAGFIGFHMVKKLFTMKNYKVVGIDNLNNYYDINLKKSRLKTLKEISKKYKKKYKFYKIDISERKKLDSLFKKFKFDVVIHLAAQAGVRFSIIRPDLFAKSNLVGFANILECCKKAKLKHLLFASSSSVYGGNKSIPFREKDSVDHPLQFYASTKRSNELMGHSYSHLFNLPVTCMRFFTIYGPWGRPDMSYFKFTKNIIANKIIKVFNRGNHSRDFTYIDDAIESIAKLIYARPKKKKISNKVKLRPDISDAPFQIFNIGSSRPIELNFLIKTIENRLKKNSKKKLLPLQKGDVKKTFADTSLVKKITKVKMKTSLKTGIDNFITWYLQYYKK